MSRLNFSLARTNRTFLGRWWWTVDRVSLVCLLTLAIIGVFLILAASPSVASHHTWQSFYFVKKHLAILGPGIVVLLGCSWLNLKQLKRTALAIYLLSLPLLIFILIWGIQIKGAQRWINLQGFSLQPSELIKPALTVLCAWMFAETRRDPLFPGTLLATGLYGIVGGLVILQPDFGMSLLITVTWIGQFFLNGLPLLWMGVACFVSLAAAGAAYFFLPHVQQRIHLFFSPSVERFGDKFQIIQSLEAYARGGFWGKGPGEGVIKRSLPDAHTDFIFAVAGEEFGFVLCVTILLLLGVVIVRSLLRALQQTDLFVALAISGLCLQLGVQAFINIASTLDLIPSKGMTLPFISYGGSSLLGCALSGGFLLCLTRKRIFTQVRLA